MIIIWFRISGFRFNVIDPDEVDESLPFGISEFERLPIFNKDEDGQIFK